MHIFLAKEIWLHFVWNTYFRYVFCSSIVMDSSTTDLSTARPKWRLDGPDLSGNLLYLLVNHAYANRYHHHLVR